MLLAATIVLGLTALAGIGLFALYQWVRPAGWWRLPGAAHGLLGLTGVAVLLAGLRGPPRGVAVLMAALAFVARRRGSGAGTLALGLHATFAVAGLALLAAYLSFPA